MCREKYTETIRNISLLSIIAVRRGSKRVGAAWSAVVQGNSLVCSLEYSQVTNLMIGTGLRNISCRINKEDTKAQLV